MKAYVISDSTDTVTGMRLAGFEGEVISSRDAVLKRLKELIQEPDIAMSLMTPGVISLCSDVVSDYKMNLAKPLIVEIPDRDGSGEIGESINRSISEAIGIKL